MTLSFLLVFKGLHMDKKVYEKLTDHPALLPAEVLVLTAS